MVRTVALERITVKWNINSSSNKRSTLKFKKLKSDRPSDERRLQSFDIRNEQTRKDAKWAPLPPACSWWSNEEQLWICSGHQRSCSTRIRTYRSMHVCLCKREYVLGGSESGENFSLSLRKTSAGRYANVENRRLSCRAHGHRSFAILGGGGGATCRLKAEPAFASYGRINENLQLIFPTRHRCAHGHDEVWKCCLNTAVYFTG